MMQMPIPWGFQKPQNHAKYLATRNLKELYTNRLNLDDIPDELEEDEKEGDHLSTVATAESAWNNLQQPQNECGQMATMGPSQNTVTNQAFKELASE